VYLAACCMRLVYVHHAARKFNRHSNP
jgi:hypothetical protein